MNKWKNKAFWKKVQSYYDNGNTYEDIMRHFDLTEYALGKAKRLNLLIPRNAKERINKDKISLSMKKAHSEGRHPGWKSVNINKDNRSYPEEFFWNKIQQTNIFEKYTIIEKFPFQKYVFDFVIAELKIDIEIDGHHHYSDKYTLSKDKIRDKEAIKNGWRVFRIFWEDLNSDWEKEFKKLDDFIDSKKVIETYELEIILKKKNQKYYCKNCGNEITVHSKTGFCRKCNNIVNKSRAKRPTKEKLEKMIEEMSWVAIGREYGVSDNAIRKWARAYDLI